MYPNAVEGASSVLRPYKKRKADDQIVVPQKPTVFSFTGWYIGHRPLVEKPPPTDMSAKISVPSGREPMHVSTVVPATEPTSNGDSTHPSSGTTEKVKYGYIGKEANIEPTISEAPEIPGVQRKVRAAPVLPIETKRQKGTQNPKKARKSQVVDEGTAENEEGVNGKSRKKGRKSAVVTDGDAVSEVGTIVGSIDGSVGTKTSGAKGRRKPKPAVGE